MGHEVSIQEHQEALYDILKTFKKVCNNHGLRFQLYAGTLLGSIRHQGFIPWDDDLDVLMPREDYEKLQRLAPEFEREGYFLQGEFSEHWPMFFSKIRKDNTTCFEGFIPRDLKTHQGIYMDVFPYDNLSNIPLLRWKQFLESKIVIASSLHERGYATSNIVKKIVMALSKGFNREKLHQRVMRRKDVRSEKVHAFFGGNKKYKKGVFYRYIFEELEERTFGDEKFPVTKHADALLKQLYGDYMTIPSETEQQMKRHSVFVDLKRSYLEHIELQKTKNMKNKSRSIR